MNQAPEEITIQELPDYSEKSLKSRRRARVSLIAQPGNRSKRSTSHVLKTTASDGTIVYIGVGEVFRKTSVWLTKSKAIDVYYPASDYVKSDDDVRRVASLIGLKPFAAAVAKEGYVLTDELIERLFEQDKAIFWVSKNGKRLLGSAFETDQSRLGPLQPISALDGLKKYGIPALDEAVERGITAVNG